MRDSDHKPGSSSGDSRASGSSGASSSLGPWLRKTRIQRGTTEADLAKALGTETSMIAMIERGEAKPGDELADRIRTWIRSGHHEGDTPRRGPYAK